MFNKTLWIFWVSFTPLTAPSKKLFGLFAASLNECFFCVYEKHQDAVQAFMERRTTFLLCTTQQLLPARWHSSATGPLRVCGRKTFWVGKSAFTHLSEVEKVRKSTFQKSLIGCRESEKVDFPKITYQMSRNRESRLPKITYQQLETSQFP